LLWRNRLLHCCKGVSCPVLMGKVRTRCGCSHRHDQ
jgi:hypothetical protein